jgi:hypothetical protein
MEEKRKQNGALIASGWENKGKNMHEDDWFLNKRRAENERACV